MRCVPHDEDTGGFFVATLRKIPKPEAVSSPTKFPLLQLKFIVINYGVWYAEDDCKRKIING